MTNRDKAREMAHIYRDRMFLMGRQICDNDWLIAELVKDALDWKDEQFKQFLHNKKAFYHNHYQRDAASAINDVLLDIRDKMVFNN